jgi:hypothetical protein
MSMAIVHHVVSYDDSHHHHITAVVPLHTMTEGRQLHRHRLRRQSSTTTTTSVVVMSPASTMAVILGLFALGVAVASVYIVYGHPQCLVASTSKEDRYGWMPDQHHHHGHAET